MNERVREVREYFSLSQKGFGQALGVKNATISKMENGVNSITDQMVLSICREWNVSEEWLRTGSGEMFGFLPPTEKEAKGRIRELRKTLNMTQEEFAQHLGVKRNTVCNYETGIRIPTNQIIVSICREWDVSEEWLLSGEGSMFVVPSKSRRTETVLNALLGGNDAFAELESMSNEEWAVVEKFLGIISGKRVKK